MSELYSLIESIATKTINSLNLTKITPCKVLRVYSDNKVEVSLISNGATYIVPNYSGSQLYVGETVQLFYRGIINTNTAYIGASAFKMAGVSENIITMSCLLTHFNPDLGIIASVDVEATNDTNVIIAYNASLLGTIDGEIEVVVAVDGIYQNYRLQTSINTEKKTSVCLSIPVFLSAGEHKIRILGKGEARAICAEAYVKGQVQIKETIFDDVTANDFVYISNTDNVETLMYIGESKFPKMPDTIDEKPISTICASTFCVSEIEAIYIPEGITRIE